MKSRSVETAAVPAMLSEAVAEIIKQRYKLPESLDSLVESYIDESGLHVMNYLGLDSVEEIPAALKYVWANIAMAAFKADQSHLEELDDLLSGAIDLKIGDTSVKTSAGGSTGGGSIAVAVRSYVSDLNRYRKLRW
ncbi:hypothetical protein ABDI30_11315 [Paenibacillus cisolokensis]|uniref:hypothetical protein n=1 Tax=Paenibacillus cisolokensis TaxID=1658519 RepID=UPI003D2CEECD